MTDTTNGEAEVHDSAGKDAIYVKIQDVVKGKTSGKNIGKAGGREIFDLVVAEIFTLATREGTVRLNGGFGSFHVRHYTSGARRLPSGTNVEFGERDKLRYEEGVVVKALVGNKGNLTEALKVRGSRSKDVEEDDEAAPAPMPPAKAAARTTAKDPAAVELD